MFFSRNGIDNPLALPFGIAVKNNKIIMNNQTCGKNILESLYILEWQRNISKHYNKIVII